MPKVPLSKRKQATPVALRSPFSPAQRLFLVTRLPAYLEARRDGSRSEVLSARLALNEAFKTQFPEAFDSEVRLNSILAASLSRAPY